MPLPITIDDLRNRTSATGFRHVYRYRDKRRTRPIWIFYKPEKKYLGAFHTELEAARRVVDYVNGKLATTASQSL